jgi:polyisoprenyl-phosphate glycosyltransferase
MSERPSTFHLLERRPPPRRLSIVIPAYNEEAVIPFLREEMTRFLAKLTCDVEVLLVNDGSRDHTLRLAAEWAREDSRIRVIHLSRNFGHQIACTAGLDHATGNAIVVIDADLQDPLDVIHRMIDKYCEGYDVVYGQRETRDGETIFKKFTAWAFYRLMQLIAYRDLPADTGDFRLISRSCLDALAKMQEQHRFLRGMVAWVGFPQVAVRYHRAARVAGETKYPLHKMLKFAWTAATSFSTVPLKISFVLGIIVGFLGLEESVRAVMATLLHWDVVPGWSSLMVATCLIGASLLISVSILGEYVGRIYEQSKERPLYLISRIYSSEDPRVTFSTEREEVEQRAE